MLFCIKCWISVSKNFRPIFLKSVLFLVVTSLLYLYYLFELIFALSRIWDKGVRVLARRFLRLKILIYVQNKQWVQNSIFPNEKHLIQFIDKFLKFEEVEYLNHVKFEIYPVFYKFPSLFSAVELKLGHKFSQFIYRFKIGTFESWTWLHFQVFENSQRDLKLGFLNVAPAQAFIQAVLLMSVYEKRLSCKMQVGV